MRLGRTLLNLRKIARLGAVAALSATLAACAVSGGPQVGATGSLSPAPQAGSEVAKAPAQSVVKRKPEAAKVAMLLPLSANPQIASVAKAMKQAGELALFEQSGTDLQLIVKDDKGTPDGARAATDEAIKEGAELILGPLLSASVQAAAPVARAANVSVIAFSNDRQVAGNGVYLLSFLVEQEVERIVSHAVAQGRRNLAALVPDDAYGRATEAAFTRAVARAGAATIVVERYQGSGTGMLEPTRRLAEALGRAEEAGNGADALFVPGGPEVLASLGPLLSYVKLDISRIKLIGSGGWDSPNLGRDATFVGGWYPAPDQRGWQEFAEKFTRTFGTAPPRIASLAFDAVGIAVALSAGDRTARFAGTSITRASGFSGADGAVRFETDGTSKRSLAVLEVQAFGARVVEPAAMETQPAARALSAEAPVPRAVLPQQTN